MMVFLLPEHVTARNFFATNDIIDHLQRKKHFHKFSLQNILERLSVFA